MMNFAKRGAGSKKDSQFLNMFYLSAKNKQ